MTKKTKLMAAAAAGVMLAAAAGAQAQAKPHKHVRHAAARSDAALLNEVKALQAKVDTLEARLATQEQTQQQTQAQVQQAQATAQTAASQAQAAQQQAASEIQTIPTQVKTAVAANRPKPGWEANTSVNGRMYFDLTGLEQKKDGAKVAPSGAGFDVKRFYVGVDHKFNDVWSANVTTDVAYISSEGLTQVYIKKAYLQAKLSDAAIIRFGSADLPWVPFVEDVYGYRFVENTLIDRTKFGTSADWGVHASGKLAGGLFNYAVAIVDGAGYKNPVRTKTMDIEGRANLNFNNMILAVGGYTGKLGKEVQGGVATPHRANRFDALAAYVNPKFRAGVEYFTASNWNTVTSALSDKSDGYSVFGSYNFTPQVSAFGRWDWVKPSKTLKNSEKDQYFNFGLNWEPTKIVDLALVYKRDKVDNGLFSTSNGAIGGVSGGTYDEVGLFGQLRW